MIKVLMCGNHPSNKGGMTSVINQIKEKNWEECGIHLEFIPTFLPGNAIIKALFFLGSYIRIWGKMLCDRPDVVHLHMSYKGSFQRKYLIHRLCRLFGVVDIIHLHGSEFEKWYNALSAKKKRNVTRLIREAGAFVVLGDVWQQIVKRIEPNANIHVVHNGIKIPKEKAVWNENKCEVLFLGVLIPRKGVSDLIRAVSELRDAGELEKVHFTIAGTGEEEAKLKKLVEDQKLTDLVGFAGWISGEAKKTYLKNSQIMISPSYNEGLPISILEAISYGMPVITTDVGDIPSVIRDQENGFLFKAGDVAMMKKAIMKAVQKETFLQMSACARQTAEENYSIDLFYDKFLRLYKSLGNGDRQQ